MRILFVFTFVGLATTLPSGKNLACSGTARKDILNSSNGSERPADSFCINSHHAGGGPTEDREFSYMSAIGWPTDDKRTTYRFDCSGVLIHPKFILTSAHCIYINDVPSSTVLIGGQNWNGSIDTLHNIQDTIIHPEYDLEWPLYDDIALIQLKEPVVDGKIICLWSQSELTSDGLTIVSYGDKKFDSNSSPILLKAEQQIVSNTECKDYYESDTRMAYTVIDKQLCAKALQEKHLECQGDFGGPLILKKCGNTLQIPYVVGIKSFGNGCGGEPPVVFTRVSEYLDWIEGMVWP